MANSTLIADAAEALLATSASVLDDPPERKFVGWFQSAQDCDQLVVLPASPMFTLSTVQTGRAPMTPAPPRPDPGVVLANFQVKLTRLCWPAQTDLSAVPAAEINAAGYRALSEGWQCWKALTELSFDGLLFDGVLTNESCAHVQVLPAVPVGPQGGAITTVIPVIATIIEAAVLP